MKRNFKNPYLYLLIGLATMAVLFISSSQTYQQQSQVGLLEKLLKNEPLKNSLHNIAFNYAGSEVSIAAKGYFSFVEFFIRKGAHFITYFILGGSFTLALYYKQKNFWWGSFFGVLSATGYAALDEFHQMLTGDRTPLFQDVILDMTGAFTAVLIILGYLLLTKKRLS
ncbi:VanZ family protein [Enterococcus canintestini]|uniref:VanZ-like domain-containing protein n=1 Tax=Enterococcus canintestini TaxID=317010 RepID=A0A267HVB8_9ENTE|nr:VanZ family protein [Enterococcus canintestini]PAB01463.1 hypothetical protein AKL21_03130 [Enterococcus canintestini]